MASRVDVVMVKIGPVSSAIFHCSKVVRVVVVSTNSVTISLPVVGDGKTRSRRTTGVSTVASGVSGVTADVDAAAFSDKGGVSVAEEVEELATGTSIVEEVVLVSGEGSLGRLEVVDSVDVDEGASPISGISVDVCTHGDGLDSRRGSSATAKEGKPNNTRTNRTRRKASIGQRLSESYSTPCHSFWDGLWIRVKTGKTV